MLAVTRRRIGLVLGTVLTVVACAAPARASMVVHRTRHNGANAVRIGSHVFTIDRWIEFRENRPGWFARHSPRLGRALAMGKTTLLERRARNPRRFDFYHPYLGWLLQDAFEDELIPTEGPFPPPPLPPPVVPPPIPPPQPPPSAVGELDPPGGGSGDVSPQVVPEPSGWILIGSAAAALGLFHPGTRRLLTRQHPRHGQRA